jgi:energy-coupling factor transporter ATP-binding protein EcfA2
LGLGSDVLQWQVQRLSTGEKQRLAILRLLANRPRALLLDEPTASLDRENVDRAEGLLLEFCRDHKAPIIWVSHDPGQLERVAERTVIMREQGMQEEALRQA